MENNNNNNGGIMLKSNDAWNKGFDSAKKCMDLDLNVPFVETSQVDESPQVFSSNVPVEPTLMEGFLNSEPHHVQFEASTVALGVVHAPSHQQVHANNNNNGVQLASSGDDGSRVRGMMLKNGTSNKRKFDWKSIREEMNVSSENNVIDFTSPLTTEKVVKALLKLQIPVPGLSSTDAGTTSRMIFSPQGNVDESAPTRRRLDGRMIEYAYNRQYNKQISVFKILSDVDVVDDSFNWRKYGQKHIKNLGSQRCYYKCTAPGCTVRKLVERPADDIRCVVMTYEGRHNHPAPLYRKKYNKNNNSNNNGADSDNNNNVAAAIAPPPSVVTTTTAGGDNNNYAIPVGQNNIVGGILNNNNNNMNMNMNMMNCASSSNAAAAPNMNCYYNSYPSLKNGAYDMMMPFVAPPSGVNELVASSSHVGLNLNLPPPDEGSSGAGIIGHNLNHVMNNSVGGSGGSKEEAHTVFLGGHFLMKDNGHGGSLHPNVIINGGN